MIGPPEMTPGFTSIAEPEQRACFQQRKSLDMKVMGTRHRYLNDCTIGSLFYQPQEADFKVYANLCQTVLFIHIDPRRTSQTRIFILRPNFVNFHMFATQYR